MGIDARAHIKKVITESKNTEKAPKNDAGSQLGGKVDTKLVVSPHFSKSISTIFPADRIAKHSSS